MRLPVDRALKLQPELSAPTLATVTSAFAPGHLSRRQVLGAGVGLSAAALTLTACSGNSTGTASASATTSPAVPATLDNAQEAADAVIALAKWGAASGSFGIASVLVENSTGRVLGQQVNSVDGVLSSSTSVDAGQVFPLDPTAHGERKMTYWYFENREKLSLPEPSALTIITSLDPCAMCTGTVLEAGFNVGVFAIDTFAGINYNSSGTFLDLPEPLRSQALARFGYYAATGGRAFQGSKTVAFANDTVSQSSLDECHSVYEDSASSPRNARKSSNTPPSQLTNPATGTVAAPVRAAYQQAFPQAFQIRIKNFRQPTAQIQQLLANLVDSTPGASNAVAFIDPFGNVVCAAADSYQTNPVAACLQNVLQTYERTRFALMDDPKTAQVANKTLTSPVNGTFVFLYAPSMRVATNYANVGAYGSTFGSPAPIPNPSPFQYFLPPRKGTVAEMHEAISQMAPLYSQHAQINPERVSSS